MHLWCAFITNMNNKNYPTHTHLANQDSLHEIHVSKEKEIIYLPLFQQMQLVFMWL